MQDSELPEWPQWNAADLTQRIQRKTQSRKIREANKTRTHGKEKKNLDFHVIS